MTQPDSPTPRSRRWERVGIVVVTVLGLAIGLAWLVAMYLRYRQGELIDGAWVYAYGLWGYDFEAYAAAFGRLAAGASLYLPDNVAGPFTPGPHGIYYYSPTLGVGLLPLAEMTVRDSSVVWYIARVLALLIACAVMPVKPVVRVFAFVVATLSLPVIEDLVLGNVSLLLLALMAVAWRWLDRPIGSIAQAMAISIRPMLGVLVIWQLLRRQWRAVAWTLGAGLVLILLTLPFVGITGYREYLAVLQNVGGFTGLPENRALGTLALNLGASDGFASLATVGSYVVAIVAIGLSLRRDREVGFIVTTTASLLLSPLLWDHHLSMLVLPAAFLADRIRPVFILLPLAAWLPPQLLPFVVIAAVFLPLLARDQEAATKGPRVAPAQPFHDVGS